MNTEGSTECMDWSIITTLSCLEKYIKFCDHCVYCFASDLLCVSLIAQELTAVSEKWQYIREELGVKQSSLEYIRRMDYSNPGDCLWRVLSKQFESCATSWKDIIAVLRTPRIGEAHLADHLEAKYCSSKLTYSSVGEMQ